MTENVEVARHSAYDVCWPYTHWQGRCDVDYCERHTQVCVKQRYSVRCVLTLAQTDDKTTSSQYTTTTSKCSFCHYHLWAYGQPRRRWRSSSHLSLDPPTRDWLSPAELYCRYSWLLASRREIDDPIRASTAWWRRDEPWAAVVGQHVRPTAAILTGVPATQCMQFAICTHTQRDMLFIDLYRIWDASHAT